MIKDRFNPSTRYDRDADMAGTIDTWYGGEGLDPLLNDELFQDKELVAKKIVESMDDLENPSYRNPQGPYRGDLRFETNDSSYYYYNGTEWVKIGTVVYAKEENNDGN
jgi:hypothetical protein